MKKLISKIHLAIYLTLRYVEEFFTGGMYIRKKLFQERFPFYLFNCLCFYLIISHIDYLYYYEAYDLATKSNWRVVSGLEGFNVFSPIWGSFRSNGIFHVFIIFLVYNIYFWVSSLIPALYKYIKKNIMMVSLMLMFYTMLEFQLFWGYYFAYLFQHYCWAAWPLYTLFFIMFHLLHFAEELEEELEQTIMDSDATKTAEERESMYKKFEDSVASGSDDPVFTGLKLSSIYDDELFGERPGALMQRYDEHVRKWYPEMFESPKEESEEDQYVSYNAEGEPEFKYLVDEQLYNINKLLAEQPKDIRQFYTRRKRWLWALPWEQHMRYKKYENYFLKTLVYIPMIKQAFSFNGFVKPKVVGPYCIFAPKWTVESWCKDRLAYNNFFIWILAKLAKRIYNFFSIFHHIDNFKWFLFKVKFLSQLNKLKKKYSKNYVYFKPRKVK